MKAWNFQDGRVWLDSLRQRGYRGTPMPSVKVSAQTNLAPNECFNRVTQLLDKDSELRRLDPKYACQFDAQQMTGTAEGKQFKAKMKVKPNGTGSEVEIEVELPFHLALAKGLVQKTLEKKLTSALG
ncbi:MAG: hypothetical protein AB7N80_00385 [Bdellovibrionales bacterium]